jgi:hypothetical protein
VKAALDALTVSLRQRFADGEGQVAIEIVLEHLDRHGATLSGHAIALPERLGGGVHLADRTNIALENFFGLSKRGERQRSGRENLAADLEAMPGAALLALNLARPDYVDLLCGTLHDLPKAFAELDAADRSTALPARLARDPILSASAMDARTSLPKPDRKLVRSSALIAAIRKASRAPAPYARSKVPAALGTSSAPSCCDGAEANSAAQSNRFVTR